jgi:hypothetical protein
MTFGSRQKGKRAERDIAAKIQAWWRQVEPGCVYKPTPSSGGWASKDARGEFKTAGDLVTTAKRYPWTTEVKNREQWSVERFFEGNTSPVWGWWEQTVRQAKEEGREPMLFFRKNREPWRVMTDGREGRLKDFGHVVLSPVSAVVGLNLPDHRVRVFGWDALERLDPHHFATGA